MPARPAALPRTERILCGVALIAGVCLNSCVIYPKKSNFSLPLHLLKPGATPRAEVERLVPAGSVRISTGHALWARWQETFAGWVDYSESPSTGNYTRSVNLVTTFTDDGLLRRFCLTRDHALAPCLAESVRRLTDRPRDWSAPFVADTEEEPDDWVAALKESFHGRITVADGKISLENTDKYGGKIRGFPISSVSNMFVSNEAYSRAEFTVRLHIQDGSELIKTGKIRLSIDQVWLLSWLIYSGDTPRSEPAGGGRQIARGNARVAIRPDLQSIRKGFSGRSDVQQALGQFDTGVFSGSRVLWARWEQVNDSFTESPLETYWSMVNLLVTFDDADVVTGVASCLDANLWECLSTLKMDGVYPQAASDQLVPKKVVMPGVSVGRYSYAITFQKDSVVLRDEEKEWTFPLASMYNVTPGRFSTPESLRWVLHLNKEGKKLTSEPISLTPSQTWQLVVALK